MPVQEIAFENLGKVNKGNISMNNLIILTGPNNSGKTYLVYILYGLYKNIGRLKLKVVKDLVVNSLEEGIIKIKLDEFIINNLDLIEKEINKHLKESLDRVFNQQGDDVFDKTQFYIRLQKEKIKGLFGEKQYIKTNSEITTGNDKKAMELSYDNKTRELSIVIFNNDLPKDIIVSVVSNFITSFLFGLDNNEIFILPAERAGLNLFYKELNTNRNALIESIIKFEKVKKINPFELIMSMTSKYPQPISDYIQFLNNMDETKNKVSKFEYLSQKINKKILDGSYKFKEDEIFFKPYKSEGIELKLHVVSSTIKSLFGLSYYLKHVAKIGDMLFIDEPELNLHPDNHRVLARLVCNIVNDGVKVVLSTHSDHFIKEINNLIMLSENFNNKSKIMGKYGYNEKDIIKDTDVNAYLVDKNTVRKIFINKEEGIIESTFDKAINEFNIINDDIYYSKSGIYND